MSGRRRIQRSIRVSLAVALVLGGAGLVAVAAIAGRLVVVAAAAAVAGGIAAVRVMYAEIVHTRQAHAEERARQSRGFWRTIAAAQAEHAGFAASMQRRMSFKDRAIRELTGTVRLAEARADEAESRVRLETRRANDAQARLAELLDEVLTQQAAELDAIDAAHDPDLPTIVDLLAWEDRVNESMVADLRDLRKEA
jgi:hypothetical protein